MALLNSRYSMDFTGTMAIATLSLIPVPIVVSGVKG